jgi:hypothetical protein
MEWMSIVVVFGLRSLVLAEVRTTLQRQDQTKTVSSKNFLPEPLVDSPRTLDYPSSSRVLPGEPNDSNDKLTPINWYAHLRHGFALL